MLMRLFLPQEEAWVVSVIRECRLQIAEDRFRVPDTMILRADQRVERIMLRFRLCVSRSSRPPIPGSV
jgi:hypothetical protein